MVYPKKLIWLYAGQRIAGYDELLECYRLTEFASPKRSTVPFLAFWRTADHRCRELSKALGYRLSDSLFLDFEYETPVQRGQGRASCSDLRLTSNYFSVVIEAKSTEPRYTNVGTWLGEPRSINRIEVLNGWLDLLSNCATTEIKIDHVVDLPYQMVHRAASACHIDSMKYWLVYQLFDVNIGKREMYLSDLRRLASILGNNNCLKIALVECNVQHTDRYIKLVKMWDSGDRDLHEGIIAGLRADDFLKVRVKEVVII